MKSVKLHSDFSLRYLIVFVILGFSISGLSYRIVSLASVERSFLQSQGNARSVRVVEIPTYRGMITDRNGEPLAISTPVESVWVNPQEFNPENDNIIQVAQLLHIEETDIRKTVLKAQHREFVYLQRGVQPEKIQKIKALGVPGIHFIPEFRRFYPEGETTAHLIGYTNIDDKGQEGIELAYDKWLHGVPGKKRVIKDRMGHIIADLDLIEQPRDGQNLALSIDRQIQYVAYRELKNSVLATGAHSGSVIVLDPKTGEVLAIVNYPSFNPNQRFKNHNEYYRNRAITDMFEPGSVAKAFSISAALTSGIFEPSTIIDTNPSWIVINGHTIRDERDNGKLTLTGVLQRSSNVGVSKIALSLPPALITDTYRRFGFGQLTASGFPGESVGILPHLSDKDKFGQATLAFGYGIAVTPLQLAQGYSVLANDGKLHAVSLLHKAPSQESRQIIAPEIAHKMLIMLESVVNKGTAIRAEVPGYRVAGKTGTSRVVGPNGYEENKHIATFVGIAPVSDPRLVIVVVINEPKTENYYAGTIAAPVFSSIATESLKFLKVVADNI